MPTAKERLSHLLVLASEGPAQRASLAGELADLLLDWPQDCPAAMRTPLVSLFSMTVREADSQTRAKLAARLGGHGELPLDLVNEFYLYAPAPVRREILTRNELAGDADEDVAAPDAVKLLSAARNTMNGEFAEHFGASMGIAPQTAMAILADASAEALAVLCKGAHLDRAMFSALTILKGRSPSDAAAQLSVYDSVPQHAAERLTRFWQTHNTPAQHIRAAE